MRAQLARLRNLHQTALHTLGTVSVPYTAARMTFARNSLIITAYNEGRPRIPNNESICSPT